MESTRRFTTRLRLVKLTYSWGKLQHKEGSLGSHTWWRKVSFVIAVAQEVAALMITNYFAPDPPSRDRRVTNSPVPHLFNVLHRTNFAFLSQMLASVTLSAFITKLMWKRTASLCNYRVSLIWLRREAAGASRLWPWWLFSLPVITTMMINDSHLVSAVWNTAFDKHSILLHFMPILTAVIFVMFQR